jgi:hypothetical protein
VKGLAGLGAVRASGIKHFSISRFLDFSISRFLTNVRAGGLAYPHVFGRVTASLENPIKRPCEAGVVSQARPARAPESRPVIGAHPFRGGRLHVLACSGRLANTLMLRGVEPADRVAVEVEKSPQALMAKRG